MTKNLARTLFVEQFDDGSLVVEEMHINYWLWALNELDVDIGLILKVPTSKFAGGGSLDLTFGLQMRSNDKPIQMLDERVADLAVARWLFNDNLEITRLPANGNAPSCATAIKRSNGQRLILLPSSASMTGDRRDSCVVRLDLDCVAHALIKAYQDEQECVRIYTRLQYRADSADGHGYEVDRGLFRNHVLLDGRFGDIRAMPPNIVAQERFVPVGVLRVFLIHPLDFHLSLQPSQFKQYERLLEHGQDGLRKYFASSKSWRRRALIHQWKLSHVSGGSVERGYNVLLVVDCDKGISEKIFAACFLLVLAAGGLLVAGYTSWIEATKSVGDALIGLIIAVALGIAVDLCVSGIKSLRGRFT